MTLRSYTSVAVLAFAALTAGTPVQANPEWVAADVDNDGFVTRAEFQSTQSFERVKYFARADRQNDGLLSPEEFLDVNRLEERCSYLNSN
ncbi:MAG: hypothetical protein KTR21_03675 [Rhodobacteraceae bacterium]|nr:hypothetical protein [Paracoccaceae bacterium]